MKREIIVEIPNTTDYRVVCKYGYHYIVNYAWWGHLQKKIFYKKWLLFGEQKYKWVEINSCWWSTHITNINELKTKAVEFYDEVILTKQRLDKQAMEL